MFNWFWRFLYGLVKSILYCIDFIMNFAKQLAGIDPVVVDYQERELTDYFFRSNEVATAFSMVALIGVVLVFLFSAFAMLRSISKMGEEKTAASVFNSLLKTMFYLLLIPTIMIIGSLFVTALMTSVYEATSVGSQSLGCSMFTIFADEAFDGEGNKAEILEKFRMGAAGYDYYKTDEVDTYFKLSDINYFLSFVSGVAVLVMLIKPLLGFVERIISLVLLYVIAPLSVSTVPLDDGARFKLWREQVLNKFFTAYGAIIAINLYALLLGVITDIQFFENQFMNGLAQLMFVLGGAAATNMGVVLFGNLINQGAGSQYAADTAHTSGRLGRVGHMLAHAGRGAARGVGRTAPMQALNGKLSDVRNKATEKIRSGVSRAGNVASKLAGHAYDKTLAKPVGKISGGLGNAYDATIGRAGDKLKDIGRRIENKANSLGDKKNGGGSNPVANAIASAKGGSGSGGNASSSQNILNSIPKPSGSSGRDSKK